MKFDNLLLQQKSYVVEYVVGFAGFGLRNLVISCRNNKKYVVEYVVGFAGFISEKFGNLLLQQKVVWSNMW